MGVGKTLPHPCGPQSVISFRAKLISAQGRRCAVCGKSIRVETKDWDSQPTLDHVYPTSAGGWSGAGNVVAAHRRCNELKSDHMPTGCEIIWLVSVCETMDLSIRMIDQIEWRISPPIAALAQRQRQEA